MDTLKHDILASCVIHLDGADCGCLCLAVMVFDPDIVLNDGFYDLVDVIIPEGCLLKPHKPAALSCRTHALGRVFDILTGKE